MIGPPFAGYSPFPPSAAVLPPRGHPAFYPQPILYWGYPSPPVSPTTYYGPAPPHVGPPHHQPALVSFFISFYYCLCLILFSLFIWNRDPTTRVGWIFRGLVLVSANTYTSVLYY